MKQKNKINFIYLIRRLKGHLPILLLGGLSMFLYVICWPILAWLSGKLIPAIGQGNTKQVLTVIIQALLIFIIQFSCISIDNGFHYTFRFGIGNKFR